MVTTVNWISYLVVFWKTDKTVWAIENRFAFIIFSYISPIEQFCFTLITISQYNNFLNIQEKNILTTEATTELHIAQFFNFVAQLLQKLA